MQVVDTLDNVHITVTRQCLFIYFNAERFVTDVSLSRLLFRQHYRCVKTLTFIAFVNIRSSHQLYVLWVMKI